MKEILELYRENGFLIKIYILIKLKICPFLRVETFFPKKGKMVDLGCGNGLFSNILKLKSSAREIIGFDFDSKKIEIAKRTQKLRSKIEFQKGNIVEMDYPKADLFALIDVLYLIPFDYQEIILKKCCSSLDRGRILIIKEMDTQPSWKYKWNLIQETLAVKIIGLTLGEKFYFRSRDEYLKILTELGFKVNPIKIDQGYWYPHILYICEKK